MKTTMGLSREATVSSHTNTLFTKWNKRFMKEQSLTEFHTVPIEEQTEQIRNDSIGLERKEVSVGKREKGIKGSPL